MEDGLKKYGAIDEFFYLNTIEIVAQRNVYRKFRVNRYELNVLAGVACYLQLYGKRSVSQHTFREWLGVGPRLIGKIFAYLKACVDKGLLCRLEYRNQVGVGALGLTSQGSKVLAMFYSEVKRLSDRDKERKKRPGYEANVVTVERLAGMNGYRLLSDPAQLD